MASPRGESDSTPTGESLRYIATPFISKTYQLVDDPTIDHVVSWNDDGSSFIVWNPTLLATDFLPKYFKHNNFSSFVRQLNTYGFRKLVPDRCEFSNEFFRRDDKRLLCKIQRRKITSPSPPLPPALAAAGAVPLPSSLAAIPMAMPIVLSSNTGEEKLKISLAKLLEENERLRKENVQLKEELAEMRSLCNTIFTIMSCYANARGRDLKRLPGDNAAEITAEEVSPKLFGVAIGGKRGRKEGGGAEEDTVLRLDQPFRGDVKSEPLDCQSQRDNQETP